MGLLLRKQEHGRDDVRGFNFSLAGVAFVGVEQACGYRDRLVELVEGLNDLTLIGDAAEHRRLAKRRQKNDQRGASLILDLLLKE